jgi:hypothetical protein
MCAQEIERGYFDDFRFTGGGMAIDVRDGQIASSAFVTDMAAFGAFAAS